MHSFTSECHLEHADNAGRGTGGLGVLLRAHPALEELLCGSSSLEKILLLGVVIAEHLFEGPEIRAMTKGAFQ